MQVGSNITLGCMTYMCIDLESRLHCKESPVSRLAVCRVLREATAESGSHKLLVCSCNQLEGADHQGAGNDDQPD